MHQYDPKDLTSDLCMETEPLRKENTEPRKNEISIVEQNKDAQTVQDKQMAQASTKGLQVEFSTTETDVSKAEEEEFVDCTNQNDNDLDAWENNEDALVDFDDSDDDLL